MILYKMRFILLVLLFAYVSSSCIEKRNEAMSDNRVGAYIPQCYDNNTWVNPQCHGSTGFCWCVTIEGKRDSEMLRLWELPCI